MDEDRLGREQIETAWVLKQLITAGVRVFSYLQDRERTLDSPTEKLLLSVSTFADEMEREKARQRTYDALARKAEAGHVTGGRVFGYANVAVDGHVERRIDEAEAVVVRRIFELAAAGMGTRRIAHTLNAEGALSPPPRRGGAAAGVVPVYDPRGPDPAALPGRGRLEPEPEAEQLGRPPAAPSRRRRVGPPRGARPADHPRAALAGRRGPPRRRPAGLRAHDRRQALRPAAERCRVPLPPHRPDDVRAVRRVAGRPVPDLRGPPEVSCTAASTPTIAGQPSARAGAPCRCSRRTRRSSGRWRPRA